MMIKRILFSLCLGTLLISCKYEEKEKFDLLILNASIVDVASGEILPDRMVGISGDTIRFVGEMTESDDYKADKILDAENKFLMPGLWDMHVHFRGGDTLVDENKDFLPLFLAHGITTVRDAGGDITPSVLEWRKQIANGSLDGPRIFSSGPKLDGDDPAWPGSIQISDSEDIERALDSLEAMGVDYVKMYDGNLTKEMFYEIIKAADKRGLKTTGHMPLSANYLEAIDYGLDGTEHMYYALKAGSPVADSLTKLNLGYGMMDQIIETYDPELAQQVFDKMVAKDVYVTPTVHIGKTLAEMLDVDHSQDSLLAYMGPGVRQSYQGRIESAKRARAAGSTSRAKMEQQTSSMLVPMYETGVKLLAGSDSGAFNSYVYPGGSLHDELQSFVQAGLSPQQALTTSVIFGPSFFGLEEFYGGVSEGKVGDLVLLENNPLENIENIRKIKAVIIGDKVFRKEDLNGMLSEIKK
ncbi:amidohydrolase family protein [Gillisia sp. Q332]|uniref:amidohydrolase family protein n=1 Tax=Gillisia xinjiangensis TaxID=3384765 RepID=UPI00391BBF99